MNMIAKHGKSNLCIPTDHEKSPDPSIRPRAGDAIHPVLWEQRDQQLFGEYMTFIKNGYVTLREGKY